MDNIVSLLFIINCIIIYMIGLNLFLEKSSISLKRVPMYVTCIIGMIIMIKTNFINMEVAAIYFAICTANFFYSGKIFEKIWINLFVVGLIYIVTSIDSMFIDKYLYNSNYGEAVNRIFVQIRVLVQICIIYIALEQSSVFKKKTSLLESITTPKSIIISFSSILIVYVGNIFRLLYLKEYYKFDDMSYLIHIFILMICITVIIFASKQKNKDCYYKWQHKYMSEQLDRQVMYYNKLDMINKQTRSIKHDMNNHMIVIRSLLENKEIDKLNEYIIKITSSINELEDTTSTGNSVVDAILNEKLQIAKDNNIQVEYEFNLDETLCLQDIDLCIIFSNTIDNAIEASLKVEEDNRFIHIKAICDRGYFIYSIKNSSNEKVDVNKGKKCGYTSKKDSINHGFGLNNMIYSVQKNNGRYNIVSSPEDFLVEIDIPILEAI